MTEQRRTPLDVDSLPGEGPEDVAALRAARTAGLSPSQIESQLRDAPAPSQEDLARRPILDGEPFEL